jgi:peptidoglycan pentaglycine glycine transferase (the first glycine)
MSAVPREIVTPPDPDATDQLGSMTADEVARWTAWDRLVAAAPDAGFMQSSSWSQFRAHSGGAHFAVTLRDDTDTIVGGAVVGKWIYQPGQCFYYIQEGPVLPADEVIAAEVFDAVLESVERHRLAEGMTVSHLRIEPRWASLPGFVRGFRPPAFPDRHREPRQTLYIDLRPSEDEILAQMKPKGRYNVRVARKHGVVVVKDNSYQGFVDFMRIQRLTADRQGIAPMRPNYFREMLSELVSRGRASLFFAEYRGRRLATALVVTCGRRATYLFGGSLALHRRVMAPYLLHFDIMRRAKGWGYEWYDLWGVAPLDEPDHAWQAISKFKRKFGGVEIQLVPTLDYVYDAGAYEQFQRVERSGAKLPVAATQPSPSERRSAPATQAEGRPPASNDVKSVLAGVRSFDLAVPREQFAALRRAFPESHFQRLMKEGFPFYRTTFWYPLDRAPENVFESIASCLQPLAQPSSSVVGVEWWFSVLQTNSAPQWLLPCHFDRNDLAEADWRKIRHPDTASVLFLNAVPYGELVVTDQALAENGAHPAEPKDMRFFSPKANRYAIFPGHLYHGVVGRMWRPLKESRLRITMAVNWWTEKPKADYLHDSRDCMRILRLTAG